jgi:hypothetical protein
MKLYLSLMLTVFVLVGCVSNQSKLQVEDVVVRYPGLEKLSITIPSELMNLSEDSLKVLSKEEGYGLIGEALVSKGLGLEEFTELSNKAVIESLAWYKAMSKPVPLISPNYTGYSVRYEGIWPNETEKTIHIVNTILISGYLLKVSVTYSENVPERYNAYTKKIIESIEFNNT